MWLNECVAEVGIDLEKKKEHRTSQIRISITDLNIIKACKST